ncbi:ParA family protein, partial [Streptococcus agalactiae]|nr:ParA family protein [Streptococcus agalactiae]
MKIITFAAIKGGVGKTTLAYNYAEWLAEQNYQVLLIDLDHQCNLTQTYDVFESENTVANIFKRKGDVNIHHLKDN